MKYGLNDISANIKLCRRKGYFHYCLTNFVLLCSMQKTAGGNNGKAAFIELSGIFLLCHNSQAGTAAGRRKNSWEIRIIEAHCCWRQRDLNADYFTIGCKFVGLSYEGIRFIMVVMHSLPMGQRHE